MLQDPLSPTLFSVNGRGDFQPSWGDGDCIFCRPLRRNPSGNPLLLRPAAEDPARATLDRLTHEWQLRNQLDRGWAVRPVELVHEGGCTSLVLEDPGGEPLLNLAAPMELSAFLRLAVAITATVSKVHRHGLVHKDLKPAHILVNCPDGEVRLTGFGLASRLLRERQTAKPPEFIAGTLPYMAPEQTGWMNRSVDCRSDLYSLGVTFYEMLTGALPFIASDPIAWIHCHIARRPIPP